MLTLFYAGALTLIALFLSFKTVQQRLGTGILLGTGESFELLQANRAHGNLVENAVFFLILTGLMEVSGQFSNLTIGILGDIFILARISHAYGIFQAESSSLFRTVGAVTSMVVLLIQAGLALWVSGAWLAANNWGF
tara:strand:- start:113 stop:523 length:411 start_codon:yes stop_codon:yes gene_type:complete